MALSACPECGRQVSSQAPTCPGCGHPLQPGTKSGARPDPKAWHSPRVWYRLITVLGAWVVAPWVARLVVALAVCVLAYFLFTGG